MDHSSEVADDFREALKDLKSNSRPEITNFTIIAKENTEHAQAISRELENHIRTTQPEYKLPALYVLDSIVKNVGTPYTVYFGHNLYRTFMDAYTLTDAGTRKAMETLLKTWKQPVAESVDSRPVFSPHVTRDIENALIKLRTIAIQQQAPRHGLPPKPPMPNNRPWPNTPTPPPPTPPSFPQIQGFPLPDHNFTFAPYQPPPSAPPQSTVLPLGFNFPVPFQPPPAPTYVQPTAPPAPAAPPPAAPTLNLAALLAQLQPPPVSTPPPAPAIPQPSIVELTTASMKIPRPHLISKLYPPNVCLTCGRRFDSTTEGKQKKADHMDWHFKVKNAMASSRGAHRTWYLTEKEWMLYREFDEALNATPTEIKTASAVEKKHYVPAPPGPTSCPICLDEFKPTWSAEANDFVFMDAVAVHGKIYHVSCWEEVNGGPYVPTPGTPNSGLSSKRKMDTQDWNPSKRLNWA